MTGPSLSPPGLVIFDCDGVLIDSETVSSRQFSLHLARFGVHISAAEVQARFTGYSESDTITILRDSYGIEQAEEIVTSGQTELYEAFRSDLLPVAGIEALIARLVCPVCVASNSSVERLENSLGLLPLRRLFGEHVYSAEMVARPKPAPDLVEYCLARMGACADEAIMIDDSPHGVLAAREAGVRAVGFITPGDPRPDRANILLKAGAHAVVSSPDDLVAILGLPPV